MEAQMYRVGLIGHTGKGNYGHGLDSVWKEIPGCQLVAVADANPAGLVATKKRLGIEKGFDDYHRMLEETKLDIVAIAPRWPAEHHDMVLAAANRRVHIYMEKPMCRSLKEADQMVAACEKNQVKLAIAFQTRYSPKLRVCREMIEDGDLGTILELRGRGKEDRRGGGEDLWVLGSHIMNLMTYLGGGLPDWCFSTVQQDGHHATREDVAPGNEGIGPLVGDNLAAMYGMSNGVTGYFASRRNMAGGRFGLQVLGSKGMLEVVTGHLPAVHFLADPRWSPGRSGARWVPVTSAGVGKPEPLKDGGLHAGNLLACGDLLDAIENDREPECNIYEARETVEMIAAVFESHRLRRPVAMPLKSRENPLTLL
jgi:predicted dehydrogenase